MNHAAALDLKEQLTRMRAFYAARAEPRPAIEIALAHWQVARLKRSYADLQANPRYAQAVEFFLSDLYGAEDFSRRDADLDRIYPVMVKLLPETVIDTVARAMEVNMLSQELDRELAQQITPLCAPEAIDEAHYAEAYRRCGRREAREHQIALVERVGQDLDRIVKKPLIYATLKLLRGPARMAGLSEMQLFLERGFGSFRAMHGADEFLATIVERETRLMEALFSSAPHPFETVQVLPNKASR